MHISRITEVTDDLFHAFERLLPQLKLTSPLPSHSEVDALISSDSSILLAARYPNDLASIVGILTLILYRTPTGLRARIEDVIVDESVRGKGIGESLMRYALDIAHDAGADGVALTSNPRRVAANRLYQRLGFDRWETNLYFYKF